MPVMHLAVVLNGVFFLILHLERAIDAPLPIDPRLQVVDPTIIRPRGRPQGARGRKRAENSTQRDLSALK